MKIKIITISDSDKHFEIALKEYEKRLGNELEIMSIKPEKNGTKEQIIEKETDKIIKYIEKMNCYKILLSISGKEYDTIALSKLIEKNLNIVFIIGGPYGLNENKLDKFINEKISFGKITLPHPLAKLVLTEQIYRVKTIIENKQYHY